MDFTCIITYFCYNASREYYQEVYVMRIRLFSMILIVSLLCGILPLSGNAYTVSDGPSVSYEAAKESMVLLKNDNRALPLTSKDKIAIFGEGQVFTDGKYGGFFLMGRGSGYFTLTEMPKNPCDVLNSYVTSGKLGGVYTSLSTSYKKAASAAGKETDFSYSPKNSDYTDAAAYANKAIYIVNRTAAEAADTAASDFTLTAKEKSELKKVCAAFKGKPVIVVLNSGLMINCGFALGREEGIYADAVITAPYMGIRGVQVLCETLIGDINPSGKTADTYAKELTDYPSYRGFNENSSYSTYYEDIYVGYRYFETFNVDVDYPFGYGLSYTTFALSDITYKEANGEIIVSVKVTNTGDVIGKESVQLYFGAPQKGVGDAKISKAAKELCGFAKTQLLGPGECEVLTMSFAIDTMASYDDLGTTGHKSAYVLEAGEYTVYVGQSVRDTVVAGKYTEKTLRVTKQLSMLCEPVRRFARLTIDGNETVGNETKKNTDILHKPIPAVQSTPATVHRFSEVLDGSITMDAFLAQMSNDELCEIAVMTRALGVSAGTGAWGASVEVAEKYGIPVADTADGPAGLRISTKGTGIPGATALACTWNKELIRPLGDMVGREAIESGVDIWLAPGVNMHRYPLCGRNFEYFSEDPYLTGVMAAEMIKGVEAHGVATAMKHLVGNEKELKRNTMDSVMSERALREIYLVPFEMGVEAGVSAIMTSYNFLNGTETSENAELMRGIVRGEWGFTGVFTTDWTNNSNLVYEIIAGSNVKSSSDLTNLSTALLRQMAKGGSMVPRSLLIENATYMMNLIEKLPDGRRLADPVVAEIMPSGNTVMQAENFSVKHGYARIEKSGSKVLMSYTRATADYIPWLEYTLDVKQAGEYMLSVEMANSPGSNLIDDALHVYVNGVEQDVNYTAFSTGSWSDTAECEIGKITLPAGKVTLKIKCAKDRVCGNFDYFTFKPLSLSPVSVTLHMTLGKTDYTVNGTKKTMDVAPIIRNSRTMLPVRYVAEALGATIGWDGTTSTATLTTSDTEIKITVGAAEAIVNGNAVKLDSPACIENSRTYMPVRFVAEALGAAVAWDGATSTATISK